MKNTAEITQILQEARTGSREAYDRLFPLVYDKMRLIAGGRIRGEREDITLTRTELVHETYLKMLGKTDIPWKDRNHFYAVASRCMRQILVDHARKFNAAKRKGPKTDPSRAEAMIKAEDQAGQLVELDEALQKLSSLNPRLVEVVEYRYFGEMSIEDTAVVMDVSVSTIKRDWAKARGWLHRELTKK